MGRMKLPHISIIISCSLLPVDWLLSAPDWSKIKLGSYASLKVSDAVPSFPKKSALELPNKLKPIGKEGYYISAKPYQKALKWAEITLLKEGEEVGFDPNLIKKLKDYYPSLDWKKELDSEVAGLASSFILIIKDNLIFF